MANTLLPQTGGKKLTYLGTEASYDMSNYPGYHGFKHDDFIIGFSSLAYASAGSSYSGSRKSVRYTGTSLSWTYNPDTGKLNISASSGQIQQVWSDSGASFQSSNLGFGIVVYLFA